MRLIVYNRMNKMKGKNSTDIKSFLKKSHALSRRDRLKSYQLQNQFNKILNLSIKTLDVAQHLKQTFFGIRIDKKKNNTNGKHDKLLAKKQILNEFQRKNQPFFMPSLEVSYQRKSKDESYMEIEDELTINHKNERSLTSPSSPAREITYLRRMERKSLKVPSLLSNLSFQVISKNKPTENQSSANKTNSIKRTNTFLFNIPSKMKPKKVSTKEEKMFKWQDQLHQNLNLIQQANVKGRQNIKVQKQKLSDYLRSIFMNQVITTYYKCEVFQNFKSIKLIVEDLMNLAEKEHNMITFFTYDLNCDGFICQEDIYFFLQRLPYTSKVLQDLYFIIEFLKKNKVRSTEANLPKKLLKKRQKTTAYMLWSDNHQQAKRKSSQRLQPKLLNQKLFSLLNKKEQQVQIVKEKPSEKKFQINFDVFNLIFAQKKPVLIQEIIKVFIGKQRLIKQKMKTEPLQQQSSSIDPLSQTRAQMWKKQVSRSLSLVEKAKKQRELLNQKI